MMVEKVLEATIIERFEAAFAAADIDGIQFMGTWQPVTSETADPKGLEDKFARGYVSVKASPRQFDTYTQAEGSVAVKVTLNVRAENDAKGVGYLAMTSALTEVLQLWQRSYAAGDAAFAIDNEFLFTGFRLDGGDCGMDRDRAIWTWIQSLTIQGVFLT